MSAGPIACGIRVHIPEIQVRSQVTQLAWAVSQVRQRGPSAAAAAPVTVLALKGRHTLRPLGHQGCGYHSVPGSQADHNENCWVVHNSACKIAELVFCKIGMKLWASPSRPGRLGRLAAAMVLLLLWLVTVAVVASPRLHGFLHADAQQANHACLITQLQHPTILAAVAAISAPPAPPTSGAVIECGSVQFPSSWDYRLSPCRAPPSAGLSCLV